MWPVRLRRGKRRKTGIRPGSNPQMSKQRLGLRIQQPVRASQTGMSGLLIRQKVWPPAHWTTGWRKELFPGRSRGAPCPSISLVAASRGAKAVSAAGG